jgi:hypothetical protein
VVHVGLQGYAEERDDAIRPELAFEPLPRELGFDRPLDGPAAAAAYHQLLAQPAEQGRPVLLVPASRMLPLGALPSADVVAVLRRHPHQQDPADDRVDREPGSARDLAELCGRFPLALALTGAMLVTERQRPVAASPVNWLRSPVGIQHGDTCLRAVFDLSHGRLTPE